LDRTTLLKYLGQYLKTYFNIVINDEFHYYSHQMVVTVIKLLRVFKTE